MFHRGALWAPGKPRQQTNRANRVAVISFPLNETQIQTAGGLVEEASSLRTSLISK